MSSSHDAPVAMAVGFWTLDRVAEALAELLVSTPPRGGEPLRAVSTDTRAIAKGDLFVALRGERFDAHDFVSQAAQHGVAAVVISRESAIGTTGVAEFVVGD